MSTHTLARGSLAQSLSTIKDDIKTVQPTIIGTNYFDLREFLQDKLPTQQLRGRVLSSMAWRIDTQIIGLARSLFYKLYEDNVETGTIDAFNEFINAVAKQEGSEQNTYNVGFENSGPFKTMVALLNSSHYWHDAAADVIGVNIYKHKSLAQLLADEKPQPISVLTTEKMVALAKAVSDGDDERANITAKLLIQKEAQRNEQSHAGRQKIMPAIMRIIDAASNKSPMSDISDEPGFYTFPIAVQQQLIEFAGKAIEMGLTQLASYSSISTLEYASIIAEALAAQRALKTVLASPKFNTGVDMRAPASYDMLPGEQEEDLLAYERTLRAPATHQPTEVS